MDFYESVGFCCVAAFTLWLTWKVFVKFFLFIYKIYIHFCHPEEIWRSKNNFAVITGATDGIGLEYAKQLATKGYSLLIVSRNQIKLDAVRSDILSQVKQARVVETLAVDFSRRDIYEKVKRKLDELDQIDVLVNNVGIANPFPEYFNDVEDRDRFIHDALNINVFAMSKMTHLILPRMVQQKHGIIINLSSFSGQFPVPMLAVYSSTKAFNDYFSKSLSAEYKKDGIIIQSVTPGWINTKLGQNLAVGFFSLNTVSGCVSAALNDVAIKSDSCGHWYHKFQMFFIKLGLWLFGAPFVSYAIFKANQMTNRRIKLEQNNTKIDHNHNICKRKISN